MKYLHIAFLIIFASLVLGISAQAAGNATLSLVKDKSSDLFVLTFGDPEGIKSFALEFSTDKPPYSGDLGGCPRSRKIDNIGAVNDLDLAKTLKGRIIDCRGGETEFEITPGENGKAQVKKLGEEPKLTPPAPSPAPVPTPAPIDPKKSLNYPIKELGGCESETACKTYCDRSDNLEHCVSFADEHHLLTKDEIDRGKKFAEVLKTGGGPGGCKSENECESYCNDIGKIDECLKFAEDKGFLGDKELSEAKKIKSALDRGQKMPGGCRNKKACEAYCQSPEHIDECLAFAKESGFMSDEELKQAEKFIPLMKAGKSPGGCKTKESCEAFCNAEDHFDECVKFAEEAGLLSDKEKEIIKKTGGKGPGGCRGKACMAYCQNPANQQVCLEFAKENGLMSDEDLKRAEEGMKFMQESLKDADPKVKACIESAMGKNVSFGGQETGDKMRECMESMLPEEMRGKFKFEGQGFSGPGGCKSREECEAYCKEHQEECGFGGGGGFPGGGATGGQFPGDGATGGGFPGGGIPSGKDYVGPGGCATPDECIIYCKMPANKEECDKFHTPSTTPYAKGRGPGGCGSVEECREYCTHGHQAECDAFVSESVPPEDKCQTGYQIERDALGYKYCNPISCPGGQAFHTDVLGRRACSTVGIPIATPPPTNVPSSGDYQKQYEEQYKQQYQQQYQQQVPQGAVSCGAGYVLKTDLSGKQYCSIVCQTSSTLDRDKAGQEYCAPICGAGSMLTIDATTGRKSCVTEAGFKNSSWSPFATVLGPWVLLLK